MNTNNILLAGLVGAVVHFLLGWLVWGILLANFFEREVGSATGVSRGESMEFWAIIISSLAFGLLIALIFGRWAGISTFTTGVMAGAVIGILMAIFYDMMTYATTNMITIDAALVDILAATIVSAIVGGVVGWMLGRSKGMDLDPTT